MAAQEPLKTSDGVEGRFVTPDTIGARQKAYGAWCERIIRPQPDGHAAVITKASPLNWTPLQKPLSESTVALVSTGGIHLRSQQPFDVYEAEGDWSSRLIPGEVDSRDLVVTHTHYATEDAQRDVNVMFPIDRLRELATEGMIASAAPIHVGFMGFIPDPTELVATTAPAAARDLQDRGVDIVLLTAG